MLGSVGRLPRDVSPPPPPLPSQKSPLPLLTSFLLTVEEMSSSTSVPSASQRRPVALTTSSAPTRPSRGWRPSRFPALDLFSTYSSSLSFRFLVRSQVLHCLQSLVLTKFSGCSPLRRIRLGDGASPPIRFPQSFSFPPPPLYQLTLRTTLLQVFLFVGTINHVFQETYGFSSGQVRSRSMPRALNRLTSSLPTTTGRNSLDNRVCGRLTGLDLELFCSGALLPQLHRQGPRSRRPRGPTLDQRGWRNLLRCRLLLLRMDCTTLDPLDRSLHLHLARQLWNLSVESRLVLRLSALANGRLFSFSTDSIYLATYNYVRPLSSILHSLTKADILPSPVLQLGDVYNRYSSSAQAAQRCALRPFLDSPPDADCPCHSTSVCCETSLEQSSLVRLSLAVLHQRPRH